jgi:hypothetical protein
MEMVVQPEGTRLRFDPVHHEYSVAVLDGYYFDVFYCPFCGAKMPDSRRDSFFTVVTKEEEERVIALAADCTSRIEIESLLGQPDKKFPPSEDFDPIHKQKLSFPGTYLYTRFSDTADLQVTFDDAGAIVRKFAVARCTRR